MTRSACPQCKAPLGIRAKFCSECGTKVDPSRAPQPSPATGERRQVTILFADICGYTRLSSELDPEELHGLLERYFDLVDGTIRDFGGTVDKHIGDAVMGLFGAPVSHGNDPERAVRAALQIHDELRELSDQIGRTLQVHIGVANGEVVAAASGSHVYREYTVLGDAVNLASRLDGQAGPGETVISRGVHRAVAPMVQAESAGEVRVKGLSDAVRIYKVTALAEHRARLTAPLIGRDQELSRFLGFAQRAASGGPGGIVYLCGEPGVGKTRLVAEMREAAERRGFQSHAGLVLDFGTARGQDAIRAIVRSSLGLALEAAEEERRAVLSRLQHSGSIEEDDLSSLCALLDLRPTPELRAPYDAMSEEARTASRHRVVTTLLERCSRESPVLILVEDVHWADPATLDVLVEIGKRSAHGPIVSMLTSRVDGDPWRRSLSARLALVDLLRLELLPLGRAAATELAQKLGARDPERLEACVARCGGNPLFLEQLLASEDQKALPDSVQSLVQARIDRLSPSDKRALQAAAVVGQRFSLGLLQHLLEDPSYRCDPLEERRLVRRTSDGWLFAHALVRDGVYSSLLKKARRDLHERAAEWFSATDPVLHAEHLDRAESERAASAYRAAAAARIEALDYDQGSSLLHRGAQIAKTPADRYALASAEGELLLYRADARGATRAFQGALAHAASDLERGRCFIGLADACRIVQDVESADAHLARAQSLVVASATDADLSRIHRIRGSLRFIAGQDGHADEELALKHARAAGDVELEARALSCLGDAYYILGRMRLAHGHFLRCAELCRQHGLGRVELYQHYMLGVSRMFMAEMPGALADTERGIEAASRSGHRRAELIARETRTLILIQMGEYAEAVAEADIALPQARATGSPMFEAMLLSEKAEALVMQDRLDEARALMEQCNAIPSRQSWWLVDPLLNALRPWFVSGVEELEETMREAEARLSEITPGIMTVMFHARAADACLARGFLDRAEHHARAVLDVVDDCRYGDLHGNCVLCLVAFLRGSRDPELLEKIAALRAECERSGMRPAVSSIDRITSRSSE